jgi:hypothetical protein
MSKTTQIQVTFLPSMVSFGTCKEDEMWKANECISDDNTKHGPLV